MPKAWQATWALGTKTQAATTPRFQYINWACLEKSQDVTHTGGPTLNPPHVQFFLTCCDASPRIVQLAVLFCFVFLAALGVPVVA